MDFMIAFFFFYSYLYVVVNLLYNRKWHSHCALLNQTPRKKKIQQKRKNNKIRAQTDIIITWNCQTDKNEST